MCFRKITFIENVQAFLRQKCPQLLTRMYRRMLKTLIRNKYLVESFLSTLSVFERLILQFKSSFFESVHWHLKLFNFLQNNNLTFSIEGKQKNCFCQKQFSICLFSSIFFSKIGSSFSVFFVYSLFNHSDLCTVRISLSNFCLFVFQFKPSWEKN